MKLFARSRQAAQRARRQQEQRERMERRLAHDASEEPEGHTHRRRAEQASYLKDKLSERERSERR